MKFNKINALNTDSKFFGKKYNIDPRRVILTPKDTCRFFPTNIRSKIKNLIINEKIKVKKIIRKKTRFKYKNTIDDNFKIDTILSEWIITKDNRVFYRIAKIKKFYTDNDDRKKAYAIAGDRLYNKTFKEMKIIPTYSIRKGTIPKEIQNLFNSPNSLNG